MANKRIVDLDPFQGSLNDEDLLIMYDDTSLTSTDRTRKITVGDFKASTSQDLSTYATKEQLNGYATTESLESYATTDSISTLGEAQGLATTSWVQTQFGNQAVYFLTTAQLPPTSEAKTNVIYLVPAASSGTNNAKDEYIYLSTGSFEKIGSTNSINLDDYVLKNNGSAGVTISALQGNLFYTSNSSIDVLPSKVEITGHEYDGDTSDDYTSKITVESTGVKISGDTTATGVLTLATTSTNNNAVVTYEQMTDYVATHGGSGGGNLYNLLDGSGSSAVRQINSTASGSYSFAEGFKTKAGGQSSHAEGMQTSSNGTASHAEGYQTTASKNNSHAEGYQTYSASTASHAEGYQTTAQGIASHAGGIGTITNSASTAQTVIGRYNTIPIRDQAFVIGNGTSSTSSNAFVVNWDGDTTAAGAIYLGSTAVGSAAVSCDQMTDYVGYIPFGNTSSLDGTMTVLPDLQASPIMSGNSITTPANNAYVVPFIVRNSQAAPVFTMENHKDGFYLITGNINLVNAGDLFQSSASGAVVVQHFLTTASTILHNPTDYDIFENSPVKYERKTMYQALWGNLSSPFSFIIDTGSLASSDSLYLFGYVVASYPTQIKSTGAQSLTVNTTVNVIKIG